ncbi:MAG: hypothetical protein B7Y36_08645 [Novosphingobium sp. 28-62-57]|uniref:DUF1636 family protein n=1 Tax=unclassified Novosphingobium TaxID=2644732 RepID=UPI000BC72338|nr:MULTISPECIES: DUF1636 family protein [unclassified Novosphingobium]OYW47986.1 MAG: hypothetical protein B7Z36_01735 [Novosphingobium sp. 12-63-9]OYZ10879.1 MAG: hypothetical protein B7Y36_08645 [Novosphingobium sp. 28-62-57]OZA32362.1 MAG: hypothetical protein B7X92_12590 [Novosphingobium sp. 17-62-9]HQS68546.1 DUF1636 family protein [Novosphingobium sp.]
MHVSSPIWLKVCVTCDRTVPTGPGQKGHGAQLADCIETVLQDRAVAGNITMRRVPCLSGCKHPGNIAVGAMGRATIRFHNLRPEKARVVVEMAARFQARGDGSWDEKAIPEELNDHLAAVIHAH